MESACKESASSVSKLGQFLLDEEETIPVLDMKVATKSLNKFISNSAALKNKESITASSRKGRFQKSCAQYSAVYQESNAF
jgi:hypothetical protein